jgi:GPH family glycoside/pentoside/hexuronide:cation symporter
LILFSTQKDQVDAGAPEVSQLSAQRLPMQVVGGFALGSVATGVFATVPTVLLLYYATEVLGIAPIWASTALLVPKITGIVWDPLIGQWSDRTRTRLGRRRPFLLAGAVGVPIAFVALFSVPAAGPLATGLIMAAAYFAMNVAYSLYAVAYIAVPAEISALPRERERLLTWRMALVMIGVLLGAGLSPHLISWGGGGRQGYAFMAIIVSAAAAVAMLGAFASIRNYDGVRTAVASVSATGADLLRVLTHRAYTRLLGAYILQATALGLLSAGTPYLIASVLGKPSQEAGTALGAMLLVSILAMPFWGWLIRRMRGSLALGWAAGVYAVLSMALWLLAPSDESVRIFGIYALLGLPFAGLQLVPYILLAHIANTDAHTHGGGREGLFTGVWMAGEKLGLALGPTLVGLGLWASGHAAGALRQSNHTIHDIHLMTAFGPALLLLASALVLPRTHQP